MNKSELIKAVAEKGGLSPKDAYTAVSTIVDVISEELVRGGKVKLVGFGTFVVKERGARKGRNPKTGEQVPIPPYKNPVFTPGKDLKKMVNR